MPGYDLDRHHRRSIRLREHGYSRAGAYYVTICVYERECVLGEIGDAQLFHSEAGIAVRQVWESLPLRFPGITLDAFVVMPNHVHGLVVFGDSVTSSGPASEQGAASS